MSKTESRADRREREWRIKMGTTTPGDPVPTVVEPDLGDGPTLPDGIGEVLAGKSRLQEELRLQVKKPVMVSIDIYENEWVYTVRGMKPGFSYWNGHKVLFYRSMDTSKNQGPNLS